MLCLLLPHTLFPGKNFFSSGEEGSCLQANHRSVSLNLYLHNVSFKLINMQGVQENLAPGDWVTSLDLSDAYFSHSSS